jgi:hypothetical protein
MSKRIVYRKCVYERVAAGPSFDARIRSLSQDVLELAKTMGEESLHPTRDNVVEVLSMIKKHLFERIK